MSALLTKVDPMSLFLVALVFGAVLALLLIALWPSRMPKRGPLCDSRIRDPQTIRSLRERGEA